MLGIADYFWRLIPANPILLRVVESGGKRRRDLIIRCAYLGLMVFLVVFSLMTGGSSLGSGSLGELAQISASIFRKMSYVQLGLVALLAPIFTAGAITQEKDSQTYDILLATPLTNGQIVLGSLLSRLFFVIALLISGIPIFSITQIFGGVAIRSIVRAFGIAAATAFVTGALAMAIAVLKVGTRRTIFSFYLFIVLYLVGLFLCDQLWFFHFNLADGKRSSTSWLTGLHPFLALRAVFNAEDYRPPDFDNLPPGLQGWPVGWYLSNPASFYTSFMFFLSFLLVTPSIIVLRRLAQSTTSLKTLVLQRLHIVTGDRTRKPRFVWANPIAWREAKTKASAARASLLRYGFIAGGSVAALILVWMFASRPDPTQYIKDGSYSPNYNMLTVYSTTGEGTRTLRLAPDAQIYVREKQVRPDELHGRLTVTSALPKSMLSPTADDPQRKVMVWDTIRADEVRPRLTADQTRTFLLGAAIIEFAVILLIVTNAAASTVTREKEDGTLDLLLTTPITSRYYIWGKLRGLVSFVLPLVAVPVASVLLFVVYDLIRSLSGGNETGEPWIVFPEAVLILPGMLIIVCAFAAILGMQMSLRCRTTVMAVMSSVGIVVGICAGLGWCGYQALENGSTGSSIGVVLGSFSPFTIMSMLINPYSSQAFSSTRVTADDVVGMRVMIFIFGWVAVGAYTAIVWSMYRSMVKNFDMTIRRQSR